MAKYIRNMFFDEFRIFIRLSFYLIGYAGMYTGVPNRAIILFRVRFGER